jgi:Fur family peroxide stress response transcriptional regulator
LTPDPQLAQFRCRCAAAGLAATHQRYVIYRVLSQSHDHPSPELVVERVREQIPSISHATVYKNIHTFVEIGLLREVTTLHQTSRLDANLDRHHHLVCVRCQKVVDFYDKTLDGARAEEASPLGFRIERYQVEAHGLCPDCQALESNAS